MVTFLRKSDRTQLILLISVSILGLILRLPTLGSPLKGDEATTFLMHSGASWIELLSQYLGPNQHTLFSLLSNLSMAILGEGEIRFRLPAFLAGVLSVPLTYWVGVRLVNSRGAALAAAFLLAISLTHIRCSQDGRGYSLTVFLGLFIVLCVLKLLENKTSTLWGGLLVGSGIGLVLTLPSNVYFLAGCGLYFFIWVVQGQKKIGRITVGALISDFKFFLVLLVLVAGYFLAIYSDLQRGLVIYENYARVFEGITTLKISPGRFWQVLDNLVSPWGPGMYLALVYGWWTLKQEGRVVFSILFATPVLLIMATGVLGPPRAYLYWLPFVVLLAAWGVVHGILEIGKRYSQRNGIILAGSLGLILIALSGYHLKEYYPSRVFVRLSNIQDAKNALSYIREETSPHQLIVFPYHDRVLRRYIEEPVALRMLEIFREGRLDAITLIGHKDLPPQEIPMVGIYSTPALRASSIQPAGEVGVLKIYRLGVNVSRFSPMEFDPDYEQRIAPPNGKHTETKPVDFPRVLGNRALGLIKRKDNEMVVYSPSFKNLNVLNNDDYLLMVFAKPFRQESGMNWVATREVATQPGFLNFSFGVFRQTSSGWVRYPMHPHYTFRVPEESLIKAKYSFWHMVFVIYPLDKGRWEMVEGFYLLDNISFFDGVQSFYLEGMKSEIND